MLLFFQINLDICVPLVVSRNICQIWWVWRVRAKQVGKCRRVWRVCANQVGKCRQVWRVRANQVGECLRVWQVQHISEKGHFGEYSNSPKMANFRRVLKFAKFAGKWPLLTYFSNGLTKFLGLHIKVASSNRDLVRVHKKVSTCFSTGLNLGGEYWSQSRLLNIWVWSCLS